MSGRLDPGERGGSSARFRPEYATIRCFETICSQHLYFSDSVVTGNHRAIHFGGDTRLGQSLRDTAIARRERLRDRVRLLSRLHTRLFLLNRSESSKLVSQLRAILSESQDLGAGLGHQNGVLELSRQR